MPRRRGCSAARDKYYIDELYDARSCDRSCASPTACLFRTVDRRLIDHRDGLARAVQSSRSSWLRRFQSGLPRVNVPMLAEPAANPLYL